MQEESVVRVLADIAATLDRDHERDLLQLDPIQLQNRQEPIMDDLHAENEPMRPRRAGSFDPLSDVLPKRSRTGSAVVAALLVGVLGTSAYFTTIGKPKSQKQASNVKQQSDQSEMLFFKPSYTPSGLCLQWAGVSELDDSQMMQVPDSLLLTGPDKETIAVSVFAFGGGSPMDNNMTGETIDINGATAVLSKQGSVDSMTWLKGKTSIQLTSKSVPKDKLVAIAKSISLRFDENGPHIATVDAPTFTSDTQSPYNPEGGNLGYIKCGAKMTEQQDAPNFSVGTSRPNPMGNVFDYAQPGTETKESDVEVKVNGKKTSAKKVEITIDGRKNTSFSWTDRGSVVSVSSSNLSDDETVKIVEGLKPATKQDLRALSKTVDPSLMMGPDSGLPTEGPNKLQLIGTVTSGGIEVDLQAAVKDNKLCLQVRSNSGTGGGDCQGAMAKPILRPTMSGNGSSISYVISDAKVTKATVTLPDGTEREIESVQDKRLPSLRVWVFARKTKDPLPTKIQFFDVQGNVVAEQ